MAHLAPQVVDRAAKFRAREIYADDVPRIASHLQQDGWLAAARVATSDFLDKAALEGKSPVFVILSNEGAGPVPQITLEFVEDFASCE